MGDDYKFDIQMLAEEIAKERAGASFYELSKDLQEKIYARAANEYWERLRGAGDPGNGKTRKQ